ncbi:MAG: hypothetical protein EA416_17400 [Trueperaceae bacterium]|nr:MAG: hypothetical protein EA416_17400 [Trueperaceae bacterium]
MQRRAAEPPVPVSVARLRQRLRARAKELGVTVGFGDGRRATDVTLVVVSGPRMAVLRSMPLVFDGLGLDVCVVRSASTPEAYEVVVSLMRPKHERRQIEGERRASEGVPDVAS